jgi:hypothetical protein
VEFVSRIFLLRMWILEWNCGLSSVSLPKSPLGTPLSGCLGSFANPHNYCYLEQLRLQTEKNWLFFFFGKGEEAGKSLSRTQSVWIVICLWLHQSANCSMSSVRQKEREAVG